MTFSSGSEFKPEGLETPGFAPERAENFIVQRDADHTVIEGTFYQAGSTKSLAPVSLKIRKPYCFYFRHAFRCPAFRFAYAVQSC